MVRIILGRLQVVQIAVDDQLDGPLQVEPVHRLEPKAVAARQWQDK
jgi:hypothetical protein